MPGMSDLPEAPRTFGFDTLAIHAGQRPDPYTGASALPIYQTSAFVFEDTRPQPPTSISRSRQHLFADHEPNCCRLRGAYRQLRRWSWCGSVRQWIGRSGGSLLRLTPGGDHVVASQAIYGGSISQFKNSLSKLGVEFTFVNPDDREAWEGAVREAQSFLAETLGNPGGNILDLALVAEIAATHQVAAHRR